MATPKEGIMLVLSRKVGETIRIGDGIILTVVSVRNSQIRLGIEAPADVVVLRQEIHDRRGGTRRLGPDLSHSEPGEV
jgi:carbon storage regulator